jgi:Asp/Glu/hydantoin racemase
MKNKSQSEEIPVIGILGWEKGNSDTLMQLEQMPGNIAHPDTFDFPVIYHRVPGTFYQSVVVEPGPQTLKTMIAEARNLQTMGVKAIMTSCGFNAIFQKKIADAINIPFFSSSLLQVPMVHMMLRKDQKVGIITADKPYLTNQHLEAVGIVDANMVRIAGIENSRAFSKIRTDPRAELNIQQFKDEVVDIAAQLVKNNSEIGAIVLECTDLPPLAAEMRQVTGLPVFDIVTLTYTVYESITGNRWNKSRLTI